MVSIDPATTRRSSPIDYIVAMQKFRTRQDLASLRLAIETANNITNYNRYLIHQIYREVVRDPVVSSQWESRKMKTKQKSFKFVNEAGEEDINVTAIFNKSWFTQFIDHALDADFWGHTLLEFGPIKDNRFQSYEVDSNGRKRIYDPITVIDRDFVKPELGIIAQTYGNNTGVAFSDPEYSDYLFPIGKAHDFGLLFKLADIFLLKNNAVHNWSEWIEVFGMDKRVGYTRTQDQDRVNFMKAIRDLGNNSFGVFNQDDKVEYIGSQRQDAFNVYLEFIKNADSSIAKLIWGQDVITNNTGHVIGEVGESISNMYGDMDSKNILELVNDRLIPFIENLGANCNGCKMQWDTKENLKQSELADRDLKISQMGFKIDPEYIETTYGILVEEIVEADNDSDIKKMYGGK
jgi:hypothetical protein